MTRAWSAQQEAIFVAFADPADDFGVQARAGTGKTTTILEGINRAPEPSILLCAFNKRIAEELNRRLHNPAAQARTLHSVGFEFVRKAWRGVRVDDERAWRLARQAWALTMRDRGDDRPTYTLTDAAPDTVVAAVVKLASLVKNCLPHKDHDTDAVLALADLHSIAPENGQAEECDAEMLAGLAQRAVYLASHRDGTLDFDDMVWLPVHHGWTRPTYDLVVVDEAQDMNATQLALARGLARRRLVAVGDDRQAIYGFRGAAADAFADLFPEGTRVLPLTVTYRCPRAVVAAAALLVPDFQAAPEAPEGSVGTAPESVMLDSARPNDFILSRTNAPLARVCLTFLARGKRARVEGRDVAKSITSLVRRMKAGSVTDLLAKLAAYVAREQAKLAASGRASAEKRAEHLADLFATVEAVADGCETLADFDGRMAALFADDGSPQIVCSSIHRAKGLEADRVFLLADTLYCGGRRQTQEEANLHYVGVTRARETLVLVTEKGGG